MGHIYAATPGQNPGVARIYIYIYIGIHMMAIYIYYSIIYIYVYIYMYIYIYMYTYASHSGAIFTNNVREQNAIGGFAQKKTWLDSDGGPQVFPGVYDI